MTTENQTKIVIIAAAIITAIGSLLPWVSATTAFGATITAGGMDGDGAITLALAAIVAVVALWRQQWAVIPATLLAGVAGYEIVHALHRVNDLNAEHDIAQFSVGFGLWLTVIAAFVAFVTAAYAAIHIRRYERITA